jgi:hypothetical protein
MGNLSKVVGHLKKEMERAQAEVRQFGAALAALGSVSSNGSTRTLSAAARRKISLAQKARWAKQKSSAKPKSTLSAAGRRRIAAAQRARWQKLKTEKKAA